MFSLIEDREEIEVLQRKLIDTIRRDFALKVKKPLASEAGI